MTSEHYANLPRKRVHVATLIFNQTGELLLLKPTYKKNWSLPGGVVEKDESPRLGCVRETREETGLTVTPIFLTVQYVTDTEKGDALFFMFDGGIFSEEDMLTHFVANEEIGEWKFVSLEQVHTFVTEGIMTRIHASLESKNASGNAYCER